MFGYGLCIRKNTLVFEWSMVRISLVTLVEFVIRNHWFVACTPIELLCNSQPRWSPGHVSVNVSPLTLNVMFVGFVAIPLNPPLASWIEPSTLRLVVHT